MSSLIKSGQALKELVKHFQPLLDVADALEKLGSIDQATQEAKDRLVKISQEEQLAQDGFYKKAANLEELDKKAGEIEKKCLMLQEKAQEKAKQIIAEAHEKHKEAEGLKLKQLASLDEKILSLKQEYAQAQSYVEKEKAHLEEIKKEIELVKSKFAKLVG